MKRITADIMALCKLPMEDTKKFISWILRKRNNLDVKVLSYPRACMTRATEGTETLMLIPVQPVLVFESMAAKPEITDHQMAMCLWRIGEVAESAMKDTGMHEAMFLTMDDKMVKLCASHGWKEQKGFRIMKRQLSVITESISEGSDV